MQLRGLATVTFPAPRGRAAAAIALALVTAAAAPARAEVSTVAGEVSLAPESQRGAPPVRNLGFVPRAHNPLKPARAYDPRPYLVVVLEGGPEAAARADSIEYRIEGATFAAPIQPVQVGVPFEIVNGSGHSPRLYAEGDPELLAGDPLNPRGNRSATVSTAYRALPIRDRDSAHIEGAVVAFPHPYFSRVGDDGSFSIEGVPAGTYTARIWYRTGWLDIGPQRVTVSSGERARVDLAIPPRLEVTTPDSDGATE